LHCVNCGRKFALAQVGLVRGGCNPHPLAFQLDGENVAVDSRELLAGSHYFPENKQ